MKNKEELQEYLYGQYIEHRSNHERNGKSTNWIMGMSDLSVELLKQEVLTRKQFDVIQEALLKLHGDIASLEGKIATLAS